MASRPFFSLVVPCYNDGRYAPKMYLDRLLTCVEEQELNRDDIEVILVDDNSPVDYASTVNKHQEKLNIRLIKLTTNLGQSNAREQGSLAAIGQWLCFSDHDDRFYPGALNRVKQEITDNEEPFLVYSGFDKVSVENDEVVEEFRDPDLDNWIHGKFYNLDNFWKRCNLHFITDLRTHEDIALGNSVRCALHSLGLPRNYHTYIHEPVYMWTDNPSSVSNTKYVTKAIGGVYHTFHETSFEDFIRSSAEPYFIAYKNKQLTKDEGSLLCLSELCRFRISLYSFIIKNRDNYLQVNDAYCSRFLNAIKTNFDLSLTQIKVIVSTALADLKKQIDNVAKSSSLPDLYGWLDYLDGLDYQSIIDEWKSLSIPKSFFSLVVPCYNDGRYTDGYYIDRLLNNLVDQHIQKDDLEVILVDDHSPVSFDTVVDRYNDQLNIQVIKLLENKGQANAREQGALAATGRWLCFADHDDLFYPNALNTVRNSIQNSKESLLVYSAFNKVDANDLTKVVETFRDPHLDTWIHGKFYNIDNFWRKCDIHFITEMRTHEDIALGSLVKCALHSLGRPQNYHLYVSEPIYTWVNEPTSTSNLTYVSEDIEGTVHGFHEMTFNSYVDATMKPLIVAYSKGWLAKDEAITMRLVEILKYWYSLDAFIKSNPENYLKVNEAYCSRELHRLKEDHNLTLAQIKVIITTWLRDAKEKIDNLSGQSQLPEVYTWLDTLDKLDFQSIIDEWDTYRAEQLRQAKLSHRPFFSLVIACWNDGRYKEGEYLDRLLDSITKQDLEPGDIEVILSDDCSPVPFDDIVNKYKDKFTIKRTKTDYNCCPGNTRAKGVELAEGEWLCFADHDDKFYDGALGKVKSGLIEKNEKNYAFGAFYGVDPNGNIVRNFEMTMNWCHAKFYNIDNFWKPMGIHFIHDLKSHEDIAICTQVGCALAKLGIKEYTYFQFPVYAWTDNPQSVSHAKYTVDTETGPRDFLEVFFDDYLHSTGYIYLDMFKEHNVSIVYAVNRVLEVMCYCYFYTEAFMFKRPGDFYKANLAIAGNYVRKCKAIFNMTNDSIYKAVSSNGAVMYLNIRKQADPGCGSYMPIHTFRYWLEMVCESYLPT